MRGWQFPPIPGFSQVIWIVVGVVLVILTLALVRNVARLPFFGGRGQTELEPVDKRFIEGKVKFEEYEEIKEEEAHFGAHVH